MHPRPGFATQVATLGLPSFASGTATQVAAPGVKRGGALLAVVVFLEIFFGSGNLSSAVSELAGSLSVVLSLPGSEFCNVNVANDSDFELLLDTAADWKHLAPPCKSLSKARRKDKFANVKVLRSAERPEGFGCKITKEANILVERSVEIARKQLESGGFFSMENPWDSYIWELKCVKKLMKMHGVRLVRIDQCRMGSAHFKPTGILTNAPWITDRLCDKDDRPHHHVPLVGFVQDFRSSSVEECFYTELAAEYPEGLCNEWAQGFSDWAAKRITSPTGASAFAPQGATAGVSAAGVAPQGATPAVLGAAGAQAVGNNIYILGQICWPRHFGSRAQRLEIVWRPHPGQPLLHLRERRRLSRRLVLHLRERRQ